MQTTSLYLHGGPALLAAALALNSPARAGDSWSGDHSVNQWVKQSQRVGAPAPAFYDEVGTGALGSAAASAELAGASADVPLLCFSDLASGPKTGNTDNSLGQSAGQDGAIVTLWGKNLGESSGGSRVFANGAEARVYCWTNATAPADLFTRHGMQMVSFQISHAAQGALGKIHVVVNGKISNPLPFTVQGGKIYFVKTNGQDTASGNWASPWRTVPNAVRKMAPGDIVYVCDGVNQTVADSCM